MNLEIFNNLLNKVKESDFIQNFLTELTDYLEKNSKGENQLKPQQKETSLEAVNQENGLYQVVDFSSNGVYLQNTETNKIFEETNLPQEIKNKIGNDYILRYQNGTYNIEQELTDKFMNNMVGIQEYKKIQENFIKESNIQQIDPNTKYKIKDHQENHTILTYGKENTIKVPNELLPFFTNEKTTLIYKNGKFEKT